MRNKYFLENWGCLIVAAIVLVLIFIGAITLPMWHWLIFSFFMRHLFGLLCITMFFVSLIVLAYQSEGYDRDSQGLAVLFFVVATVISIIYLPWSSNTYGEALVRNFKPQSVNAYPATQGESIRYYPYQIAKEALTSKQNDPQRQVGDIDPQILDSKFLWVAPRIPQDWNVLSQSQDGVMVMGDSGQITPIKQAFRCSEEKAFRGGIAWQLFAKRFRAEYPEVFYYPDQTDPTKWLAVAPYVLYEFNFPVWVPRWGGDMVIDQNCKVEDLPKEKAINDLRLKGAPLFPSQLAREMSNYYAYKFGGFLNAWFYHVNGTEEPRLEGFGNTQPYYQDMAEWEPQWIMIMEPAGPSKSVSKIFFVNAHTGETRLVEYDQSRTFNGPAASANSVKSKTSGYTWASSAGSYEILEPRLINRLGKDFYWQYSVAAKGAISISFTPVVNAKDQDDIKIFCTRQALVDWVDGKTEKTDSLPCPTGGVATDLKSIKTMTDKEILDNMETELQELKIRQK